MTDQEKSLVDAIQAIKKELDFPSDAEGVAIDVAASYMRREQHEEALKTYAMLLLINPINADAQIGMSNCLLKMGKLELAMKSAAVCIQANPGNARAYLLSGKAALMMGYSAEAVEDFNDAINLATAKGDREVVTESTRLLALASGAH